VCCRYGGLVEVGDREVTLSDMYALNLDKLDRFEVLAEQPADDGWVATDDDGDDDDDGSDEGSSEDGSSDEEDQEDDNASETSAVADGTAERGAVQDAPAAGVDMPLAAVDATLVGVFAAPQVRTSEAGGSTTAPDADTDAAWDDDDFEPTPVLVTSASGMVRAACAPALGALSCVCTERRRAQSGGAGMAANTKTVDGGRARREALRATLRTQNAEAVPKMDEPLAEFYARTCP
jgi:hypothetical protein